MTERCRIVFTDAAVKECARVGHDWHWEQQSGDRGFIECYRCGDTKRHMVSHKAYLAASPEDRAGLGESPALLSLSGPEPGSPPFSDDPPPVRQPTRAKRRDPRRTPEMEARDAEILAEHFAGRSQVVIARRFGLTSQRVHQIVAKHQRGEQRRADT
ncbi:MAG: hypothetical protein KDE27_19425 [Planctomycetes bacterium]|nr:hypothetical protein [Planctomycetota bacterium]